MGPRCRRKPPHVLDAVFDPKSPVVDPLGWRWELRGIVPKAFLREIKSDLVYQRDKKLEMIQGSRRRPRIVAAPNVEKVVPARLAFALPAPRRLCFGPGITSFAPNARLRHTQPTDADAIDSSIPRATDTGWHGLGPPSPASDLEPAPMQKMAPPTLIFTFFIVAAYDRFI
jgi:hypothetical protein